MTKILSARDLLELVTQQDGEDRAAEEVSETTRGRRIYSVNHQARGVARPSVEQRLPMIETAGDGFEHHKTLEFQAPHLAKLKPQVVYDLTEDADFDRHKTLELQAPHLGKQKSRDLSDLAADEDFDRHKTLELQLHHVAKLQAQAVVTAPAIQRGSAADDDEVVPSSRRKPPSFSRTLEMQLEEPQSPRGPVRTIEMSQSEAQPLSPRPAPVAPAPPIPPVAPSPPSAPAASPGAVFPPFGPTLPVPPVAPKAPQPPKAPEKPVAPVPPEKPVAPAVPVAPLAPAVRATGGFGPLVPRKTQKLAALRPEEDPANGALPTGLGADAGAPARSLSPRAFPRVQAPKPILPREDPEEDAEVKSTVQESDEPVSPAKGGRRPSTHGWARTTAPAAEGPVGSRPDDLSSDTLPEIPTDENYRAAVGFGLNQPPSARPTASQPQTARSLLGWATSPGTAQDDPSTLSRSAALEQPDDDGPVSSTDPVALTGDETLVLLNYDQTIALEEVAEKTGLTAHRVSTILERLLDRGVIGDVAPDALHRPAPGKKRTVEQTVYEIEEAVHEPSLSLEEMAEDADLAVSVVPTQKSATDPSTAPKREYLKSLGPAQSERTAPLTTRDPTPLRSREDDAPEIAESVAEPPASGEKPKLPVTPTAPANPAEKTKQPSPELQTAAESLDVASGSEAEDGPLPEDDEPASSGEPDDLEDSTSVAAAANYQRHYELVLSNMTADERAHLAATGSGTDLFSLVFDKEPGVIRALWDNAGMLPEHARFAAFHHRTALGLEKIVDRGDFARDPQVQRRLIRNPMLSETVLRRLLMPKRLIEIYKAMLDRDVPERSRTSARGILRTKFTNTEPEDRVQLIWNTEGRVLQYLTGLTIDSKSTALMCSRPIVSLMLVQSFCKFPATPPSVIHHCLKQNMVRRQLHLRNQLLKHPNCPSEAKRAF